MVFPVLPMKEFKLIVQNRFLPYTSRNGCLISVQYKHTTKCDRFERNANHIKRKFNCGHVSEVGLNKMQDLILINLL